MNQILGENPKIEFTHQKNNIKKFKIIFWFFIFLSISSIILFIFLKYNAYKKEKISKNLINNFGITTLYSTSNNYTTNYTNLNQQKNPFVIGLIQIDKINLLYPILSETSEDSLNISPCRFYGPMPNEIGNLCIAGHNNANDKLFGKLDLLNINDTIRIYDLKGSYIDYYIYNRTQIKANDTSCMNQNTNGQREITLITCNNLKSSRLLIKAKEGSL